MDRTKLERLTKEKLINELKIKDAEIYALKRKLRKATLENLVLKDLARSANA